MTTQAIYQGNNLDLLALLPDCSVDAVVTDPPYGLSFMGKDWDAALPDPRTWAECLRVLKPGGHLVAFGASRLYHRLACQIEDAGFEMRECLMWVTGQGFPKGLNVVRELARLGQCLLENAPHAVQVSASHLLSSSEGSARIAAALVEITPEGERALITQIGGEVALLDLTAMSLSESVEASTVLSILSSWKSVSAGDSKEVSKCITATACETTTDPKTLSWLIGQTTSAITTLVHVTLPNGEQWPAISAAWRSSAAPSGLTHIPIVTAVGPATWNPVAAYSGFDLALKPSYEPIALARKPLSGTVAANVLAYGTGALNIDGCRVEHASEADKRESESKNRHGDFGSAPPSRVAFGADDRPPSNYSATAGRWPANLILDEDAGALLDAQSGTDRGGYPGIRRNSGKSKSVAKGAEGPRVGWGFSDSGGASRFFKQADFGEVDRFMYCPKASRSEREAGLDHLPPRAVDPSRAEDTPGRESPRAGAGRGSERRNHHATVKPVDLMRWLVRLVTPPGGIVLEPFAGSGTTLVACALEGRDAIGMELDPEYVTIGRARVAHAREGGER